MKFPSSFHNLIFFPNRFDKLPLPHPTVYNLTRDDEYFQRGSFKAFDTRIFINLIMQFVSAAGVYILLNTMVVEEGMAAGEQK